ncbi:MAG: hypothetical protein FJW27_05725 [Acidimicrobiia bacterium]|nr:hypothetical protein [Acidimicrobiia bacterium]
MTELAFTSELELTAATPSAFAEEPGLLPTSVDLGEEDVPSAPELLAPNYLDAALAAFSPEIEAAQRSRARTWEPPTESWRAELNTLPPPPAPAVHPSSAIEQAPRAPAFGAEWGDVLSAIRRDIEQRRAAEEAQSAAVRSKADVTTPPLVFPTRAVAPSVIAAIESGAAERVRPEPLVVASRPALDVVQPDRALAALLETVSNAESLRVRPALEVTTAKPLAVAHAGQTTLMPTPLSEVVTGEAAVEATVVGGTAAAIETPLPAVAEAATGDHSPLERVIAAEERVEPRVEDVIIVGDERPEPTSPTVDPLAWLTAARAPTVSFGTEKASTPADVTVVTVEAAQVTESPAVAAFTESARPSTAAATPALPARAGRPPKGKKKRKPQRSEAPQLVLPPIDDWGFFDPQTAGFGPLVARLNQLSAGMEAYP